jgi:GT2 family glycosyltransferase
MAEQFPRVDIITVNYNGRVFLEEYFKALEQLDYPKDKLRVFFVDNASGDGSVEFVRTLKPGFRLEIIANQRNLGFARANNLIIPACSAEYISLLNNDTRVEKDWLFKLAQKIQSSPDIGIVTSRQVPSESPRLIDPVTQETSWCSGGHCLIRKSALDVVGYLDEKFFMYGEDVDLSWRIWLGGYKCVYVPEAVCQHHYRDKEYFSVRRLFYHVRNSILLRYTYGEGRQISGEIRRWVKEGLAAGIKRFRFQDSYAIIAGVLAHFFFIAHFKNKGKGLKARPQFKEIKQKWITL